MNTITQLLSSINPANPKFAESAFLNWSLLPATSKGKMGEEVAKELLKENGYEVAERNSKEHDYICNGKMIELKTAFLKKDSDYFTFYGYDATEDPHFWDLQFVFPEEIFIIRMDRKAMADIYLGKTRKNTMFTITLEDALDAQGETVAYFSV